MALGTRPRATAKHSRATTAEARFPWLAGIVGGRPRQRNRWADIAGRGSHRGQARSRRARASLPLRLRIRQAQNSLKTVLQNAPLPLLDGNLLVRKGTSAQTGDGIWNENCPQVAKSINEGGRRLWSKCPILATATILKLENRHRPYAISIILLIAITHPSRIWTQRRAGWWRPAMHCKGAKRWASCSTWPGRTAGAVGGTRLIHHIFLQVNVRSR